jgi:DNA processing protein
MGDRGREPGIECVRAGEQLWPEELQAVASPPDALWLRGRTDLIAPGPRVAIVGSRSPTPYGLAQAARFSRELAEAGVCIVSGLARGVDAAAHAAALDAGGATLAVLGCGVDRPWPFGPATERVAHDGLLVSEHPPGTPPRRHHFPLRNRILAALSDAVLVVEAAHRSGSLITARWAADQGQQVLAVPGRVDHPMARGVTRLLREGATPVESPAMLLEDVFGGGAPLGSAAPDGSGAAQPWTGARPAPASAKLVSEDQQVVLGSLQGETLTAEEVADRTGLGLGVTLAALTTLELDGSIRRCPGGLHERI